MISSGMLGLRVDHRSAVDGHVRLQAKYVVCVKLVSIVGTHGKMYNDDPLRRRRIYIQEQVEP